MGSSSETAGNKCNKHAHTCPISAKRRDSLIFVADLSYRDRKRVGFVFRNRMSVGNVFQVIFAHTVSRISSRDNFVEYIGNGVGFRKVGWVGSVKIVSIESKM